MLILSLILILYSLFLLWNLFGIIRPETVKDISCDGGISIIIPFRNEENSLTALWSSLKRLKGLSNKVEIIFVNDHSTDKGVSILTELIKSNPIQCSVQIVNSANRGKKSSIQFGVHYAKFELILITDADVKLHADWVRNMLCDLNRADLVLGSVINNEKSVSLLNLIQDSEALMLEGIKTASANNSLPLLASGANLGFRKNKFLESDPYGGNLNIASGDDMFLLQIAKNENWKIISNSNSPSETNGAIDFNTSIKQHRRWAAKTPKLNSAVLNIFGILTVMAHVSFISSFIFLFFNFNTMLVLSLIIKFLVEFLFLFSRAIIFNRLKLLFFAPVMSISYPFYLMAIIIRLNKDKTNW